MASKKGLLTVVIGISLIKRGWNEIPEIMCCLGLIAVGTVMGTIGTIRYLSDYEHQHMYKRYYHVVRDTKVDDCSKDIYS